MANYIMLQGTSSHVGKSILTTALCRIFYQDGQNVVPFKAQNMALNSYVTKDGKEMGRAQVAQAEAAGLEPAVDMNPVLLKPTGNACSQVILMGESVGNMSAKEYHQGYSLKAFSAVKDALKRLDTAYDTIVIEGAGSPAEVNLKANDIVNMRVARHLQAPVLLIADIDRGGALASLVGTLELLEEEERALVKGLIINKFRGDVSLLLPAVEFLEQKTGKKVLGIIPHMESLGIDDEDSVSLEEKQTEVQSKELSIAVIQTPKISNFTDFDALAKEPDVSLYYVKQISELGTPDLILLPGSKNTTEDLLHLRNVGLEAVIKKQLQQGTPVIGICGGYQMLGKMIYDPFHTESGYDQIEGMDLLPMETTFNQKKLTAQVAADCIGLPFLRQRYIEDTQLQGYEIHMGQTKFLSSEGVHPFVITTRSEEKVSYPEGFCRADGLVWGTYLHGIFDNDHFRRRLLNGLRAEKKLPPLTVEINTAAEKERSYNRLADVCRRHLDMDYLKKIMVGEV